MRAGDTRSRARDSRPVSGGAPEAEPAEPEPSYTHGRFVWFSHWSKSPKELDRARSFYEAAFGWELASPPMETEEGGEDDDAEAAPAAAPAYLLILRDGREVGTMSVRPGHKGKAIWLGYISVADVDGVVGAAVEAGGKALGEPAEMDGVGRFAHASLPNGAVFGVVTAERGDPPWDPRAQPGAGSLVWMELWTRKGKAKAEALGFLGEVVGYQEMVFGEETETPYSMLAMGEVPWGGVTEAPKPAHAGRWVPYVVVEDVDATVAAMRKARGKPVGKPFEVPNVGRFAIVEDPVGALIGVIAPAAAPEAEADEDDDE